MSKYAPWIFIAVLVIGSALGLYMLISLQAGAGTGAALSSPVTSSDWQRGATSTSKVTLVEYTDFQCPACGAYYPVVKQLEGEFADSLTLVVRHYPLPQHQNAKPAARAAEAAGKQGKFWDMFDALFSRQSEWSGLSDPKPSFIAYAKAIGLNEAQFLADYSSSSFDSKIQADIDSGTASGVLGTPSFYLNGVKIDNPSSYDVFKVAVKNAGGK